MEFLGQELIEAVTITEMGESAIVYKSEYEYFDIRFGIRMRIFEKGKVDLMIQLGSLYKNTRIAKEALNDPFYVEKYLEMAILGLMFSASTSDIIIATSKQQKAPN